MYNADTRKIVGTGSLTSELSSASAVEQTTKVGFGSFWDYQYLLGCSDGL